MSFAVQIGGGGGIPTLRGDLAMTKLHFGVCSCVQAARRRHEGTHIGSTDEEREAIGDFYGQLCRNVITGNLPGFNGINGRSEHRSKGIVSIT
jgi:hypothetical protein